MLASFVAVLIWIGWEGRLAAQARQEVLTTLNPLPDQVIISEVRPVSTGVAGENLTLQLQLGFGTHEVFAPGTIFDSFSITLQTIDFSRSWLLATFDASGVVWAPVTPGTEPLNESSVARAAINYPSLLPDFRFLQAYVLEFTLPDAAAGQPLNLYFDLYNNQNGTASQAWFTDVVVVPEPGVATLGMVGVLMLWLLHRRRKRVSSKSALCFFLIGSVLSGEAAVQEERAFVLNNVPVTLVDATPSAAVYYTSMRLNRALNVWNVEVSISNRSSVTLAGPVVLLVDAFSGTSGPQGADGIAGGNKGFYNLSAQFSGRGLASGQKTSPRTLTLGRSGNGSPVLTTKVFVRKPPTQTPLGLTRTLNEAGQPLPSVTLQISGPSGLFNKTSDRDSGVSSFGQDSGAHTVKFSRDGYLPVWRQQMLASNEPVIFPNPRLTKRSENALSVTPLAGVVLSNSTGTIRVEVPAGALSQRGVLTLTPLTGQTLPAFLPLGWSPLGAFWLESSSGLQAPLQAAVRPLGPISRTESALLVRWDEPTLRWLVVQSVPGNGTNAVTLSLPEIGAYALVVGDTGEWTPPSAQVGQVMTGASGVSIDTGALTASGSVTPSVSPASVVPAMVTGTAQLEVRHATRRLPSGYVLRGEVTETYLLSDGSLRLTPQYEHFIVGYQRPGDQDLFTVHANFPMRPVLLFGPERLNSAEVKVDVLPESAFDGEVLDTDGGQVSNAGVRVLAGTGRLTGPSAVQLRRLDGSVFTNVVSGSNAVIAAFDLTVDRSTLTGSLSAQLSGAPTNALFVLSRVLSETGFYGLQPIERLRSDAQGNLSSLEPATGGRLPGLSGSGQFVLVQVGQAQTLVEGVARNGAGNVQSNMPVSLVGLPWLTLSAADGKFQLVGPAGERQLSIRDPLSGDTGFVAVTVGAPQSPVTQDLSTAPSGPRVAKISPANQATKVPRVGSVVIEFNEAVNPASILGAIQLLRPDNSAVTTAVTLNLANRIVTLNPATELEANTTYRVKLAATIRDTTGLPLEGGNEFTFTTVPASTRVSTAQLIVYEPGATNVPAEILNAIPAYEPGNDPFAIVVHGQPGVADPEVAVILANESTGETTTVLSKVDGSFSSVISGTEQDFVSATFVNLNGTRIYVSVSRQEFDNGFVGLYPQGGILEAQSDGGPVRIIIEPNSIPIRTKFKMEPLGMAKLLAQLGGVTPTNAKIAGSGINLRIEGTPPTLPMQVRFPVNLTSYGYPTNEAPTNAAAALAVVRNTQDVTSFEVMDQLLFTPQAPGEPLLRAASGNNDQLAAGFLNTSVGLVIPALGPTVGAMVQIGFNQILVPMLFGARPVVIKGKVAALPMELAIGLERAGVLSQFLNAQTGNQYVDIPYQLAQQMGLGNPLQVFGGAAQQLLGVGVFAFEQQMVVLSKPLAGAFVSVRLSSSSSIRPIRGRIFPGMVYSTSGADGYFLAMAPAAGAQYLIDATHPLYAQVLEQPVNPISIIPGMGGDLGLAGAVYKNFYFFYPNDTDTPPSLSVANTPIRPVPGQPCLVVVDATLATGSPKIAVSVKSIGTNNLLTGQLVENAHYTLDNITNVTLGNSARWTGTLTVDKPVLAMLTVIVDGPTGEQDAKLPFPIAFTGPVFTPPNIEIPAPDTNDVHGPLVVEARPSENGFLGEDGEITIYFNKPIDAFVTNHLSGVTLSSAGNSSAVEVKPLVALAGRQQVLTLRYLGLQSGGTYRLTLSGQSIRDLANQPLDQRPSTTEADSYSMTFRTAPAAETTLPAVVNGRGSGISGMRLYVLDQTPQGSFLNTYDISSPLKPFSIGQFRLKGTARDLVVLPRFGYQLNASAPVETNDLVVVVGGDLDAQINQVQGTTVSVAGQYIYVINMGNPDSPQVLASPTVSYRVGSALTELRWAPPNLVYLEFGADIQLLGFVNLQEMLFGFNSPAFRRNGWGDGRDGEDLNGDGDYVDAGEKLPIPQFAPIEFYGKKQNLVIQNTTQKILDYSVSPAGNMVGVTLRNGIMHDNEGRPRGAALPAMYRTLVFNGLPLDISNPLAGMFKFGAGAYPRWVSVFDSVQLLIDGAPTTRALALVSQTPNTNGVQALAVIDISLPLAPRLIQEIPLSEELLGGVIGNVTRRSDGLLEVAGGQNIVLLNPLYLAVPAQSEGQLSPAVVGVVQRAGGPLRNLASTEYGLHVVAEGGRNAVVLSAPQLRFVNFPSTTELVNPQLLWQKDGSVLSALFQSLSPLGALAPANVVSNATLASDLTPPNLALHYHVLMLAPGGAGGPLGRIELGLESLNASGRPLVNLGVNFAPVRAVTDETQSDIGQTPRPGCGAPIRSLTAFRVSNDPHSEYYNWFLSRPFALITAAAPADELAQWKSYGGVDREILFSGAALRAFIDPKEKDNAVVGTFAGQIDPRKQMIFPVAQAIADTVNRSYLTGDNPPPNGGPTPMEDTYGTIQSHSGELRTSDVDISLPSPRLPISITRAIGNQDNYEGPFGVGWDFNYNQRLTVLDPLTFPQGLQMPLLLRSTAADSEIAGSQDVLFNTGLGFVYHFVWKGTNMPPEYASDPLVQDLDYARRVSDYYLAPHGLFELLVKSIDGRFERLTPDGMRYRYTSEGRLEMIIDRYPRNRQELQYDNNGWLRRIDDRSVPVERYLEFGHYRRKSADNEFREGLDMDTTNPYLEGKICRLRDFTGRDVLFEYDANGFLITRKGIEVGGENGGFTGRNQTFYSYADCRLVGISAKATGTPLVSAVVASGNGGKPVARAVSGTVANNQLEIPVNNSAATVGTQTSGITLGDGAKVQRKFDAMGNLASETVIVPGGTPATHEYIHNKDGLQTFVKFPEGNAITRVYDSQNPIFRSRANLLSITVDPGPRGGEGYTETFHYDERYNLQSGDQVDANGFITKIALTSDRRDVQAVTYGENGEEGTRTVSYNSSGQPTSTVQINGIESSVTYNAGTGYVTTEKAGDLTYTYIYDGGVPSRLGQPKSISPPAAEPTHYAYNNNLQMVEMTRGGLAAHTGYDELGRSIFQQEEVGAGKKKTVTRVYNEKSFVTRIVTSDVEVNGVESSFENNFVPDSRSRIKEARMPNGAVKTFTYDGRGNVTQVKLGDYVEEYGYDRNNNRISLKKGGEVVFTTAYDGLNRVLQTTSRTGNAEYVAENDYYRGGQLRSEKVIDPAYGLQRDVTYDEIDALGRQRSVTLHGNLISPRHQYTHAPLSSSVTGPRFSSTTTWDKAGNQAGYSDPNVTVTFGRDANGRIETIQSTEQGAAYSQFFGYNSMDQQTSIGDLLGTKLAYEPRADGLYQKVINARGNAITMDHSSLGEKLKQRRADGMEMAMRHNAERQVTYTGDAGAGFTFEYDSSLRLTKRSLRNGALLTYKDFDGRNLPASLTFPGGSSTQTYDLLGRLTQRSLAYQSTTWEEGMTYDALNRVRRHTYLQNGGGGGVATYDYDPAGPLTVVRWVEDGADFSIRYGYYPDGARSSVTYPSGVVISETRDNTGRLTGLSDANGSIVSATAWKGNSQPRVVQLGATMETVHEYDVRGRLTGSRTTRKSDGAVLAHLRYQYDAVNNIEARQMVHRSGRADSFSYDTGERLSRALMGARPLATAGFSAPQYSRSYNYDAAGRDFLTTVNTTNFTASLPAFATTWSGHDSFLLPTSVDGYPRGPSDPLGNVAQAALWGRAAFASAPVASGSTLQHDGLGRLVSVTRQDGLEVRFQYQPGGLRFSKQVRQGGTLVAHTAFVHDGAGRLIEEYDGLTAEPALIARYYYASGDAPTAGDFIDPNSGQLARYYFLRDVSQSVVAVADASGDVVERTWYDPHGQPVIEQRDVAAPRLKQVSANADASGLLIALSESVWKPLADPGAGGGIVRYPEPDWAGVVKVSVGTTNLAGTVKLLPSLPGFPPYSVVEFKPDGELPEIPSALEGWWPADQSVIDVAGGNNGALVGGATNGAGLINQAFVLNGTSAYVSVPDNASLDVGTADFTVALWAKFQNIAGQQVIIEKWDQAGPSGWSLLKLANNRLRLSLGSGAGSEVQIDSGTVHFSTTAWVQYAVRRQGSQFTVFTNGVAVVMGSSPANLDNASSLKFGSRSGSSSFLNGALDEVTLFSRALNEQEMTAIAGGVAVPGIFTVTLNAGTLADEWGNSNETATVSFAASDQPSVVFYSAFPAPQTAPVPLARSSVGSPFLFHGQYLDYETGLVYLRARYYDPFSGMFLEPDPLGYEDSVNHFAGMANNPVSLRDPSGLRSAFVSMGNYFRFLKRNDYTMHEIQLVQKIHSELTHQGLGDIEIAAHVRVMSRDFSAGSRWEISIRKTGHAEARMQRTEEGYQGKIEEIVDKTQNNALVKHKGREYTGDLDGLYLLHNGQPATLEQTQSFQAKINDEMARLSPGYRDLAGAGGQKFHGGDETQMAYHHGVSLNLPQEYGTKNNSMEGVTHMGWKVWNNLERKMKKGTGEAFAFSMSKDGNGFDLNPNVDVNRMIRKYEKFYNQELFNPASTKYDKAGSQRYNSQVATDRANGGNQPLRWFPQTFYGHNYGGGVE